MSNLPNKHFDHHRLRAWHVALAALVAGNRVAGELPRGHASMRDQLRRALQGAFLQLTEAAARKGPDRQERLRVARAEAGEAAAALEAIREMKLGDATRIDAVIESLWLLSAMITRLGRFSS